MKDKSVLFEIKKFQGLVTKELFSNEANTLSTTQYLIIEYLINNKDKDVYQKDIEKALNLSRATTSGVLGTMEKNGLIKRVSSKIDTRTKVIEIEECANKCFNEGKKRVKGLEEEALKDISQDEIHSFLLTLDKMKKNIRRKYDKTI